jgi:hypothetical protein
LARAQIAVDAPPPPPNSLDPDAYAPRITPENDLERAFLAAYSDPARLDAFRHTLLRSEVAIAMQNDSPASEPVMITTSADRGRESCVAMFTSEQRMHSMQLPPAPDGTPVDPPVALLLTGREALTRYRDRNIALNETCLAPNLILHPVDIERYLAMSDDG